MKKFLISLACIFAAMIAVPLSIVGYSHSLPKQYGATYYAAMSDKFARLKSVKERKIVLVGGSNLPFGIDSGLIEREIGLKVVNFGLYAALGSKTTLDLSKTNINEGDIVIFSPEYSAQTYSKYIDGGIMLQTLETDRKMLFQIPLSDYSELISDYPEYIRQKREFIQKGTTPKPEGVYSRDAFNEYGDISYERKYNVMPDKYDPTMLITIDKSIVDDDFAAYFNNYIKWAKGRKADVYISFPPVNAAALSEQSTFEKRLEFYEHVRSVFDCKVIGNIEDNILHEDYFYDTNYHLNDSGVIYRTAKLIGDIKHALNMTSPTDIVVPPGSGSKPDDSDDAPGLDDKNVDFVYSESDRITITGVTAEGKNKSELIIPASIDGKKVYKIAANAFAACNNLQTVSIPKTVTVLEDSIFAGAPRLISVKLLLDKESDIFPLVGDRLFDGANPQIKLYVPKSKLLSMKTHYTWSKYSAYLFEL